MDKAPKNESGQQQAQESASHQAIGTQAEGSSPRVPNQAAPGAENASDNSEGTAEDASPVNEVLAEVKAQVFHTHGFLHLNYFILFWVFVAGCVFGLVVETAFHAIVYGGLESRAGLVWGPFSPIYGVAAVILTAILNRFYHSHNLVIFLISMVLGSALEYCASLGMEYLWGAIAWDYTGTFGSINGRTNFAFGVMWGLLGMVWVRTVIPFLKRVFAHVDQKNRLVQAFTVLMTVFMVANVALTVLALDRQSDRASSIPATTPVQQLIDDWFPDSYMQARFQNMSVYGSKQG